MGKNLRWNLKLRLWTALAGGLNYYIWGDHVPSRIVDLITMTGWYQIDCCGAGWFCLDFAVFFVLLEYCKIATNIALYIILEYCIRTHER